MDITLSIKISPEFLKNAVSCVPAEGSLKHTVFDALKDPSVVALFARLLSKITTVETPTPSYEPPPHTEKEESEEYKSDDEVELTVNENYSHHAAKSGNSGDIVIRKAKKPAKETAESAYFRHLIAMADACDDDADIEVEPLIKSAFTAAIADTGEDEFERDAFEACHKVCIPFLRLVYPTGIIKGKTLKESAVYLDTYMPLLTNYLN